ncbi:FAD:protein FMN transferase [Deinococcus lacus]|uniref:FAD:protein FMN transferase n=1 Tax=Deinococcus lacus TaxID=392561 RepID=A0ABW1YEV2_9DEIO
MWPRCLHRADYEQVLGTFLSLQIGARSRAEAAEAEKRLWDEVERLSNLLHPFDPSSELNRWQSGTQPLHLSPELQDVLALARTYQAVTGGAFHPGVVRLGELWDEAAATAAEPDPLLLQAECSRLQALRRQQRAGHAAPALPPQSECRCQRLHRGPGRAGRRAVTRRERSLGQHWG